MIATTPSPVSPARPAFPPPPGFLFRGLEAHRIDLERFLAGRCRDAAEVDDVVQESFLRAARYRGSLDSDGALRPWLLRIASNVLANRLAKELRRGERQTGEDDFDALVGREREPIEDLGEEEFWVAGRCRLKSSVLWALGRALQGLEPRERRLLIVYYRDRAEARRIARELGWSSDVLKVRLFRSRRRLRRELLRMLVLEGSSNPGPEPRRASVASPVRSAQRSPRAGAPRLGAA